MLCILRAQRRPRNPSLHRLAALGVALLCWTAATAQQARDIRVVYTEFAPYAFTGADGVEGYSVDVLRALAQRENWNLSFTKAANPQEALQMLAQGSVDLHPNISPTPARREIVDFTDSTGIWKVTAIVDPKRHNITLASETAGLKLGYVAGSIGRSAAGLGTFEAVEVESTHALVGKFLSGDIDGVLYVAEAFERWARIGGFSDRVRVLVPPLRNVDRSIAVARASSGLFPEVQRALTTFQTTDEYHEISTTWFSGPSWVSRNAFALIYGLGALVVALGAFAIVAIQRQRTSKRQHRQTMIAEIFEEMPLAVTVTDRAGNFQFFNPAYRNLYPESAHLIKEGASYMDVIRKGAEAGQYDLGGRSVEDWLTHVTQYQKGLGAYEVSLADGRLVEGNVSALSDGGVITIRRDVTAERRHEREVSALSERLIAVLETATNGIIGLDRERNVLFANSVARHILGGVQIPTPFGWPDEIIFLDQESLSPLEASNDPVHRALAGQSLKGEIALMTRLGSPERRYVRISTERVSDPTSPIAAVVVFDDVSDQEKNRQQIERSSRLDALGQLTGGIAHDFNNLLATVLYALKLIRREPLSDRAGTTLDIALTAVERGSTLTGRLLAFARKQPGLLKSQPMSEVLDEFKSLVLPTIEESIKIEFAPVDEDLWVYCEPSQLDNAMLNLVLNSRDAIMRSGNGNRIDIIVRGVIDDDELGLRGDAMASHASVGMIAARDETRETDVEKSYRYVEITVRDNGPGMSEEVKRRAIDPFFTTKDTNSGTGLGLSMVYGFVQQSNGELRIYSDAGQGTTVQLVLPCGTATGGREEPVDRDDVPLGGGETILVVEDEMMLGTMIAELLEPLGYSVRLVRSGAEAISLTDQGGRFDLMLTDVVMPDDIGGFELARLMRERKPDLPILYMSGYTGYTQGEMGDVVAPLLQKPCSPRDLGIALREALDGAAT